MSTTMTPTPSLLPSSILSTAVLPGPKTETTRIPLPTLPSPNHILIRVVVAGSNPKDWKVPYILSKSQPNAPPVNQGDDIAGVVAAVGDNVTEFKVGDRIGAFHEMLKPGGAYAEYAVAPAHTAFHLGSGAGEVSFEEAATVPLAAMTAALGLFQRLRVPGLPWAKASEKCPLIIYGAASAVGAFAVKLAVLSNIHPVVCVAGRGTKYVESIIDKSKGDVVINYQDGDEAVVRGFDQALEGKKVRYAFDAVSEKGSYINILKALDLETGRIALVLPGKEYSEIPKRSWSLTQVGRVHSNDYGGGSAEQSTEGGPNEDILFGELFYKLMGRGLREGWFRGHPYEVVPGGLGGIQQGLSNLKQGKASAVKYVYRIEETKELKGPRPSM